MERRQPMFDAGAVAATTAEYSPRPGLRSRFLNALRALALALPLPARLKVRIYYSIFTDFFEIMSEGSGMLNYGQEELCRTTAAPLPKKGAWLDVGCGVGGPACFLAQENPDVEITGINITKQQVARAKRKSEALGLADRVRFEVGDACAMPFDGEGSFDGLYAIETAFHFPDKRAFAREARRLLKPGGRFSCSDMVIADQGISKKDRLFNRIFHKWLGVLDMHQPKQWRDDLTAAGFEDVEIVDISETALKQGLIHANRQIDKMMPALRARFPKLLIRIVRWGNQVVIDDIDGQPMRYVHITARAPTSDSPTG